MRKEYIFNKRKKHMKTKKKEKEKKKKKKVKNKTKHQKKKIKQNPKLFGLELDFRETFTQILTLSM